MHRLIGHETASQGNAPVTKKETEKYSCILFMTEGKNCRESIIQ